MESYLLWAWPTTCAMLHTHAEGGHRLCAFAMPCLKNKVPRDQHHCSCAVQHAQGWAFLRDNLTISPRLSRSAIMKDTAQPDAANALWTSGCTRSKERCERGGIDWA